MVRIPPLVGAALALGAATIGAAQAYYVRELTPGWPPGIHGPPPPRTHEFIEVPIEHLQFIALLLVFAIIFLAAVALYHGGRKK